MDISEADVNRLFAECDKELLGLMAWNSFWVRLGMVWQSFGPVVHVQLKCFDQDCDGGLNMEELFEASKLLGQSPAKSTSTWSRQANRWQRAKCTCQPHPTLRLAPLRKIDFFRNLLSVPNSVLETTCKSMVGRISPERIARLGCGAFGGHSCSCRVQSW